MRFKDYDKKFMLGLPLNIHTVYKEQAKSIGITTNELIIRAMVDFMVRDFTTTIDTTK